MQHFMAEGKTMREDIKKYIEENINVNGFDK